MSANMTKVQFDTELKSVKSRGITVAKEFSSLVRAGVNLYWGETNHNIQVINDLVDCASAIKGLRVLALVEYLNEVVPHKNKGKKDNNHYGKMDAALKQVMSNTWKDFLIANPEWHSFTQEKTPKPFEWSALIKMVGNKISKAHEKGEADDAGLLLFKDAIAKYNFEDEETNQPSSSLNEESQLAAEVAATA